MADVNYIEYGENSLNVVNSAEDITRFGADNGDAIGNIIAIIFFLLCLVFILILVIKFGKNVVKTLFG